MKREIARIKRLICVLAAAVWLLAAVCDCQAAGLSVLSALPKLPQTMSSGFSLKRPARKPRLAGLKNKLRKKISRWDGDFSVYIKDLETNEYFVLGNHRMYAASLIKLYAMGAVYQKIKNGKLKESALKEEIRKMIVSSDNWCFNDLAQKAGVGYINNWINAHGYTDTRIRHGCLPAENSFGEHTSARFNRTSAKDCGRFLERVYREKCVSKSASRKMLALLKDQSRRTKIPAGIPSGIEVANKTGETDDTSHDAAIVFSPGGDYIIVVMVTAPGNGWGKNGEITKISEITYNYFTKTQGG